MGSQRTLDRPTLGESKSGNSPPPVLAILIWVVATASVGALAWTVPAAADQRDLEERAEQLSVALAAGRSSLAEYQVKMLRLEDELEGARKEESSLEASVSRMEDHVSSLDGRLEALELRAARRAAAAAASESQPVQAEPEQPLFEPIPPLSPPCGIDAVTGEKICPGD